MLRVVLECFPHNYNKITKLIVMYHRGDIKIINNINFINNFQKPVLYPVLFSYI